MAQRHIGGFYATTNIIYLTILQYPDLPEVEDYPASRTVLRLCSADFFSLKTKCKILIKNFVHFKIINEN